MKRTIFAFVALFLVYSATLFAEVKPGDLAPEFTLTTAGGETVSLSDYRGKALILHFWATWCPPCKKELPEMETLSKKISSAGKNVKIQFLGVCISDTQVAFTKYMQKNRFSFTSALDAPGASARLYGVYAIPTTILISPEGKIEKIRTGVMTEKDLAFFTEDYLD